MVHVLTAERALARVSMEGDLGWETSTSISPYEVLDGASTGVATSS